MGPRTPRAFSAALLLLATACGDDSNGSTPPPGPVSLRLVTVAQGLINPLFVTAPPGDNARLFVVEQGGRIRIVKNGQLLAQPFLDISTGISAGGERGLLGLAFSPSFGTDRRFYVSYTDPNGDSRVVRYQASASNPDVADVATAQPLLFQAQPFANHNGGQVSFGPDGFLYVSLGDGGSGGDPQNNGQQLGTMLGKLLRIDVSGTGTSYAIPADNPFRTTAGARPEIWAYGLRNAWRFSFDRQTGDLYVADVGQNEIEEVNVSPATSGRNAGRGLNYGWRVMEGTRCFNPPSGCNQQGLTLPALEYTHAEGCSVTGGYVYRGQAIADLRGTYFYADFCNGWVRSFRWSGGQVTDRQDWTSLRPNGEQVSSFGEDAAGELYLTTFAGRVYRIEPAP